MVSLTIRNIPEEILKRIRIFAIRERRSLNSEILIILENGLLDRISTDTGRKDNSSKVSGNSLSNDAREAIWKEFSGQWVDKRSLQETIIDTYLLREGSNQE